MLFDFASIAPRDRYKLLVSTVAPRPIAWIVSRNAEGCLNAAPFSFFNVLSGDPPVVGIVADASAPAFDSSRCSPRGMVGLAAQCFLCRPRCPPLLWQRRQSPPFRRWCKPVAARCRHSSSGNE